MSTLFGRKGISIFVLIMFFSMVCCAAYPAYREQTVKTEKQEKVKKTKAEAEAEGVLEIDEFYSREKANVIEDEGSAGGKKKKFPWLLVAGGAVVIGVVLYFTVFKTKKYELTVNVGEGVTGSPASGIYKHKKGSIINYSYSPQAGYEQLSVKLDGSEVDPDGSIKINIPHSLSAAAMKSITAGIYSGTTDQGFPVSLKVSNASGVSNVNYYQIKMESDVNTYGYSIIITLSGNPAARITNYTFSYSGASLDLSGTFTINGTSTATGTWDLHYNSVIYGVFTGSGTYNASNITAARPVKSFSRLRPGEVMISAEIFKEGRVIKRFER